MGRRLFLAGATGVIGVRLIPLLLEDGFEVAGMTRSAEKGRDLAALGVKPVVCDVYDQQGLIAAVRGFDPDVVMHQLTDLPDRIDELPQHMAANNRIRTEGTRNLIAAAQAAGATRFLTQSVAWELPGESGEAARENEHMTLAIGGVVVRYGQFYGPGTFHPEGPPADDGPRVEVHEAAARTPELIDAPSAIYEVTDLGEKRGLSPISK